MDITTEELALQQAKAETEAHKKKKPAPYVSSWEQRLSQTVEKLLSRPAFSYDPENDPVYHSYRDAYTRKGKLAMEDTMGKAAALTGGYGNSYAVTSGQDSYNRHMQQLTDKIPELYSLAESRYQKQTQLLQQDISYMQDQQALEQKEYDAEFDRWLSQLDRLTEQEQDAFDRYMDKQTFLQKYPQTPGGSTDNTGSSTGTTGTTGTTGSTPGSTSGASGKNYDNGSVSEANIRKIQKALGVKVDGKWGAESRKAAGGVDADTAWANYLSEYGG